MARQRHVLTAAVGLSLLALLTGCGGDSEANTPPGASAPSQPSQGATARRSCTTSATPFPKTPVRNGSYVIEPDQWNASGTVCLDTPGDTGFTVAQIKDMVPKSAGAPGAYPNIATAPGALGLPVPVSALGDATSDWSASTDTNGSYDLAYDLWYGPNADDCIPGDSAELMIWLDATDNVQPAGTAVPGTVTIGDADYEVYLAPKTSAHTVISYVRSAPTHTAKNLNLRLFTQDALERGYLLPESYLCKVSAGFEIWSGGVGLRSNSFSFRNVVGLPTGTVRSDARGTCLAPTSGGAVGTGDCGGAGVQWTLANDGTVRGGGLCLQADAAAAVVRTAPCTGEPAQRWSTGGRRQIVSATGGQCLTAGDGAQVGLAACANSAAQHWGVPYNGLA